MNNSELRERLKVGGRRALGWFCSYTPVELIDAAGFAPVRVEGTRGTTSGADTLMHTNICPYVKACLEAAEGGNLDFIEGYVFTTGCDAQRRLYDVWKFRDRETRAHLLYVPKQTGGAHARRFLEEVKGLKAWLEETSGKPMSDESLRESIRTYAELRARLREIEAARRNGECGVSGARMMEVLMDVQRFSASDALAAVKAFEAEAKGTAAGKGPTVLLVGNMLDDPEFVRRVEKFGARVTADDLCTGRRFVELPEPNTDVAPVEALVEMYLTKYPCPRMCVAEDTVERMGKLVDEMKPDGVIIYTLKFCDAHLYNTPRIREMLREKGVKALFVEGDYTSGSGQMETRIQAFVEMLG